MFGQIGPMEIILVLVIALIVLGPKKLPEAGKSLGKGLREFKDTVSGITGDDDRRDEDPLRHEVRASTPTPAPAATAEPASAPEPASVPPAEREHVS